MPLAGPVDAPAPSAVARAQAEAAAELDSPQGVVALAAVANDSSSAQAAVVERRDSSAPTEAALVAVRQAVQWWVQRAEPDSQTTQRSCTPADARIASSRR